MTKIDTQGMSAPLDPEEAINLGFVLVVIVPGLTIKDNGEYVFDSNHSHWKSLAKGEQEVIQAGWSVRDPAGNKSFGELIFSRYFMFSFETNFMY